MTATSAAAADQSALARFARDVLVQVAATVAVEALKGALGPATPAQAEVTKATESDREKTLRVISALINTDRPLAHRLAMYAPQVDYFNAGVVDHRFIRDDRVRFESRWPLRRYTLRSLDEMAVGPDGSYAIARYTVDFHVARPDASRSGSSQVAVVIGSFNSQPRIHAIKEWVNRRP